MSLAHRIQEINRALSGITPGMLKELKELHYRNIHSRRLVAINNKLTIISLSISNQLVIRYNHENRIIKGPGSPKVKKQIIYAIKAGKV